MAVHFAAAAWSPGWVLCGQRLVHPLSRELCWVLQPTAPLGALHHGQHPGLARGLQAHCQSQRQSFNSLHGLSGYYATVNNFLRLHTQLKYVVWFFIISETVVKILNTNMYVCSFSWWLARFWDLEQSFLCW